MATVRYHQHKQQTSRCPFRPLPISSHPLTLLMMYGSCPSLPPSPSPGMIHEYVAISPRHTHVTRWSSSPYSTFTLKYQKLLGIVFTRKGMCQCDIFFLNHLVFITYLGHYI